MPTAELSTTLAPRTTHQPGPPDSRTLPRVVLARRGTARSTTHHLTTAGISLGRDRTCDIVLDDHTVSRRHARIACHGEQFVLHDADSLNGTYLNRSPLLEPAVLADGDEIRLGRHRLTVHLPRPD